MLSDKEYGHFFYGMGKGGRIKPVNGIVYRDILELWLTSQLPENRPDVYQHGRAPPHIHNDVTAFLNQTIA